MKDTLLRINVGERRPHIYHGPIIESASKGLGDSNFDAAMEMPQSATLKLQRKRVVLRRRYGALFRILFDFPNS